MTLQQHLANNAAAINKEAAQYAKSYNCTMTVALRDVRDAYSEGFRAEADERLYSAHVEAEGRQSWNASPDGCYHCGSSHHHSGDCQDRG